MVNIISIAATDLFEFTMGSNGTAVDFFGGQWWLVGMFLLILFSVVLFTEGVNSQSIALILLTGSIVILGYQIFTLVATTSYFQTAIFFILMFAGWFYYRWIVR